MNSELFDLQVLAADLVNPSSLEPFGTYIIAGDAPAAAVARSIEREVFEETFGNSRDLMAAEYGPYEDTSLFICVIDHATLLPVGVMRIIRNSPAGFKSLQDLHLWGATPGDALTSIGRPIDPERVWDIATLAVTKAHRKGAEGSAVSIALYQALCTAALACDVGWFVAILDVPVFKLLQRRMKRGFTPFAGLEPLAYLDSAASLPVWCDVEAWCDRLQITDPHINEIVFSGGGLPGTVAGPSWLSAVGVLTGVEYDLTGFGYRLASAE
jgi:hypothetical protein